MASFKSLADKFEINALKQVYWGNGTVLKLYVKAPGGYKLLKTLKKDWQCDAVFEDDLLSENQPPAKGQGRSTAIMILDRDGKLKDILKQVTIFEISSKTISPKRWQLETGPHAPIDDRKIWRFGAKLNVEDVTPVI
jgi:hypothetical protein